MKTLKRALALLFALCIVVAQATSSVFAASYHTTTPSGYTSAADVEYNISGRYVANWGARGEVATFLTTYAQNFYTGSNTFDSLSQKSGGTSQSNAPSSALYSALKSFMTSKQSYQTSYNATRDLFKYTDCLLGNTSKISSFYSGTLVSGTWDGGSTWNREHVWPNSKGDASGNGENDIMMLRPTSVSENSGRGNKAYGESSSFYNPTKHGSDVRGDCARIVLFVYTRWGNTVSMWGSSGVMENLDILLKWMEVDPVDTWELGRNDAVQSITGTRNVFVDYPEFAFLLFGEKIPKNMQTPSGMAKQIGTGTGNQGGGSGNSGNTNSQPSNQGGGSNNQDTNSQPSNQGGNYEQEDPDCPHSRTVVKNAVEATCSKTGYSGDVACADCGYSIEQGRQIKKSAHKSADGNNKCDVCGATMDCLHQNTYTEGAVAATCTTAGFTGDEICEDCKLVVRYGVAVESAGNHTYGEWTILKAAYGDNSGLKSKTCTGCGDSVVETIPAPNGANGGGLSTTAIVLIIVGGVVLAAGAVVLVIFLVKKKKVK